MSATEAAKPASKSKAKREGKGEEIKVWKRRWREPEDGTPQDRRPSTAAQPARGHLLAERREVGHGGNCHLARLLPGQVQDEVSLQLLAYLGVLNKENIPSRAYIAFKNEEILATFSREYDGHVFRDKAGNESIAIVEFAPFQKVPNEKKKQDSRAGTIEKDEDYISFLESLKEASTKPSDADTLEALGMLSRHTH
ncbi:hypothetical protein NUW54_g14704 [Trametes sanguinea]|uniref:Uncharacterized protein n=1 Tax=Trametes sanguinea TaxID=158606 RepID=A0ACC1MB54_9APHY|nr:hypothetical protein NUW54_g14704 [Trametes sanguinea]